MTRAASIAILSLGLGLLPLAAQDPQPLLLPSSRTMETVAPSERNPFAKPEVPKLEVPVVETSNKSEEARIEAVLEGLKVVGRTRGENGWKVLLGDLILEQGKILPPIIEGQTNVLRVANVYESMIEIEWVSKDNTEAPRRIFIMINMKPTVGFALGGRKQSTDGKPVPAVITHPAEPSAPGNDVQAPPK